MIKKIILLACLFASITAVAQKDSLQYYQRQLTKMHRNHNKALWESDSFKLARSRVTELMIQSDNYSAFMIFANMASLDFNKFNADNASAGFGPMKGNAWNFGIGFSGKKRRGVFDLTFFGFGKARKINNGNSTIKLNFTTTLQFDYGYDLIKHSRWNIYPYVGLAIRAARLQYDSTVSINANPANISSWVINNRKVDTYDDGIRYRAGLGLEYVLHQSKTGGGSILFVKAGTCRFFKEKGFKFENSYYNPQLKYGDMDITFGLKLFGRN